MFNNLPTSSSGTRFFETICLPRVPDSSSDPPGLWRVQSGYREKNPIIVDEGLGVEKAIFIHYAWENAPDITVETADTCYAFLAEAHPWWKSTTTFVINPTNPQGLSESFIGPAISSSAETWDVATSAEQGHLLLQRQSPVR